MSNNFPDIVLLKKSKDGGRLTPDEAKSLLDKLPSDASLCPIKVCSRKQKAFATGYINTNAVSVINHHIEYADCLIAADTALKNFLKDRRENYSFTLRNGAKLTVFITNTDEPVEEDAEDMVYTIATAGDITTDIELMIAHSGVKYRVGQYENEQGIFYIFRLYADGRPSEAIYELLDGIRNMCRKGKASCQITASNKYANFLDPEKMSTPAILYKEEEAADR